jgi:hypothetical protein
MSDQEKIKALCCAVARLAYESEGEEKLPPFAFYLGDGGTLVEVNEIGQVFLDGVPVGEPDTGFRYGSALVEA